MRQQGKDLYTTDGLGFDAADAAEFFSLARDLERSQGHPARCPEQRGYRRTGNNRMFTHAGQHEAARGDHPRSWTPRTRRPADSLVPVEPELTPPSPAPRAGLGDISLPQTRFLQEVRFDRSDPATAAQAYVDELTSMLTG